jgi:hypothetical protein
LLYPAKGERCLYASHCILLKRSYREDTRYDSEEHQRVYQQESYKCGKLRSRKTANYERMLIINRGFA